MSGKYAYILMIQDKWWREFLRRNHEGRQVHSYVQKGPAPPRQTFLVLFYVSKPVGELAGCADFIERKVSNPEELWREYGAESVLDNKEAFEEFIGDRQKVSMIRFRHLREALHPIPRNDLLMHLGKDRLARRGFYIEKDRANRLIELMT